MGILERSDCTRLTGLPLPRRFLPFVMPGRNESAVFFDQKLRVDGTLAYLSSRPARAAPELSPVFLLRRWTGKSMFRPLMRAVHGKGASRD